MAKTALTSNWALVVANPVKLTFQDTGEFPIGVAAVVGAASPAADDYGYKYVMREGEAAIDIAEHYSVTGATHFYARSLGGPTEITWSST